MCGEQLEGNTGLTLRMGSPPRVRGTVSHAVDEGGDAGITPACAGNRCMKTAQWCGQRDHPRVCGEQLGIPNDNGGMVGSPPRVRGTVICPDLI